MQSLFFGGGGATRTTTNGNKTNNDTDAVAVPPLLLALGTLQWGTTLLDDRLINAPRGNLTENEAHEIWNEFVVKNKGGGGVTIVDTAEGYGGGTSEKRLGRLCSSNNAKIVVDGRSETTTNNNNGSGGSEQEEDREIVRVLFMTKFLPAPWRYSRKCFERALRASNHRLNIECCPVYLLHSPVHWRPIEYWIEAAAMCKRKGLLKSVGLSNCNANQVRRAVEAGNKFGVPVVCNQVHYSLLDYNSSSLREMEATCRELNVTIVAYSPLGQGLLTDRELSSDNKVAKMLRLKWNDVLPLRSALRRIADAHSSSSSSDRRQKPQQQPDQHPRQHTNVTMAQVALNWCRHHDTIPLVGCRSKHQAVDSLQSLTWTLSDDEVAELDRLALDRSTLDSPPWRRAIFVSLASVVMVVCRALDRLLGYRGTVEKNASVEPERQAAAAAAKDKSQ